MSTSFSKKCEILAEVYKEALWNKDLEAFKEYNDVGLPLAYVIHIGLASPQGRAKKYIEQTWRELCNGLKVDPDKEYKNSDDLLEQAGIDLDDDEEDDEELKYHRAEFKNWYQKYSPMEYLNYDGENGQNFLRAKATPHQFVWTAHGTCEDAHVTSGFNFYGDPPRCCWDTYGWWISEHSSEVFDESEIKTVLMSFYSKCKCYDPETEEGDGNCEDCSGYGRRTYWFDKENF